MGQKKKKLAKGRLDKFYYLAKEQGYRSRAAYKLIQLNKKYNFLGSAKACLDLCAAPGGWMQVASKYMPVSSLIVGVDLVPIRQVRNCIGLTEDITTQKCRQEIKKALKTWKVDVCLHDGAPNMGTSWVQDAYQQAELTLHALKLATEFLTTGGWFVTKVFRGRDYNSLNYVFNKLFKKVESTKPQASRNASAEIFVVCQGFINPKKIDPKLLDPKFVFKEVQEGQKKVNILSDKKQKRNRSGYDDDVNVLYKKAFVSDFIQSTEHLRLLANINEFEWDEASQVFLSHPSTTEEIKGSLKDVKVLGKFDFSRLIKWRKEMIQYKEELDNPKVKDENMEVDSDALKPKTMEELDENLEQQMKEYMVAIEKKKRKEKKKANEKKRDLQKRIQLQMHIPGDQIKENEDTDLYTVRGQDREFGVDLDADQYIGQLPSDSEDEDIQDQNEDHVDFDNDEYLEHQIEVQYNNYLNRIQKRDQFELSKSKIKKFNPLEDQEEEEDDEDDEIQTQSNDQDEDDNEILKFGKRNKPSAEATANMFYDQGLFNSINQDEDEEDEKQDKDEIINPLKKLKQANSKAKKTTITTTTTTTTISTTSSNNKNGKKSKYQSPPQLMSEKKEEDLNENDKMLLDNNNFEVVPMEKDIEYESEDEETEDQKINTLALGQFLLRKKSRDELYDNSFNRYSFNDQELPMWFTDDENKHNKPQTPLTREMVSEIKKRIKEIDSRPIKKVAEAKARKKFKLTKKLDKAKDKADSIVDNPEMTNREKVKAIEKIYSGTEKKSKNKKIVMIARKGKTQSGGTGKYKMVDKRMKKDLKIQKAKEKRTGIPNKPKSKRGGQKGKRTMK